MIHQSYRLSFFRPRGALSNIFCHKSNKLRKYVDTYGPAVNATDASSPARTQAASFSQVDPYREKQRKRPTEPEQGDEAQQLRRQDKERTEEEIDEEKSTFAGSPGMGKPEDSAANRLIDKLNSNVERGKLTEVRKQFLKGFIGDKLQEPLPKCPIECMFWDWIYSFFPENELSSARFTGFTREFVTFLIDNKKFAESYLIWIQQNQEALINAAATQKKGNVTAYDVRMYADMFRQIIREKLHCAKHKVIFAEYAAATVNGMPPRLPDELLAVHICGPTCCRFAVGHLITFQHREYLRNNFAKLFADRWIGRRSETEVLRPIGKAGTNPAISRLKLATRSRIEEILRTRLPKGCEHSGRKTDELKDVVEDLAGVILLYQLNIHSFPRAAQALDKAYEVSVMMSAPNLFKFNKFK